MSPMGPSVEGGYRGGRGNVTRGVPLTMGVTGIHWSRDMDQSTFSIMKRLTQKYVD